MIKISFLFSFDIKKYILFLKIKTIIWKFHTKVINDLFCYMLLGIRILIFFLKS